MQTLKRIRYDTMNSWRDYLVLYRGGKNPNGSVFSCPGKSIADNEVPGTVLRAFRKLAVDIVKVTESKAGLYHVEEEEYTVTKIRKVIVKNECS